MYFIRIWDLFHKKHSRINICFLFVDFTIICIDCVYWLKVDVRVRHCYRFELFLLFRCHLQVYDTNILVVSKNSQRIYVISRLVNPWKSFECFEHVILCLGWLWDVSRFFLFLYSIQRWDVSRYSTKQYFVFDRGWMKKKCFSVTTRHKHLSQHIYVRI